MPSSLALGVFGISPYIFSIRSRFRVAPSLLLIILCVCVSVCYIKQGGVVVVVVESIGNVSYL